MGCVLEVKLVLVVLLWYWKYCYCMVIFGLKIVVYYIDSLDFRILLVCFFYLIIDLFVIGDVINGL